MKERPILFSAPMVRALLDGRKTQTRRIVKLPPDTTSVIVDPGGTQVFGPGPYIKAQRDGDPPEHPRLRCPYGYPGDRLWVREEFALESNREIREPSYEPPFKDGRPVNRVICESWGQYWEQPHYRATDPEPELAYDDRDEPGVRWKPSIHMPRWASRITLEITEVRVQRLQDISEEDAKADGVFQFPSTGRWKDYAPEREAPLLSFATARDSFFSLWEAINGTESLAANPWVWAISFKRLEPSSISPTTQPEADND